jgi:transposase
MGTSNYSDAFKRDAVQQIRVRGSPVREVSQPLGVNSHSLYKWMKPFAEPALKRPGADHEAENRRLQREPERVTEEREILEKGEPLCATGSRTMAKVHIARESQ